MWSQNISDNEPLINQPPLNINSKLAWNTPSFLGLDYSKITLETSYTFEQFQAPRTVPPDLLITGEVEIDVESEIFDFQDAPDGYFLTHTTYEWKKQKFGGQLQVRNLFNVSYRDYLNQMRYFADEPGTNVVFSLNYQFFYPTHILILLDHHRLNNI